MEAINFYHMIHMVRYKENMHSI